MIKVIVFGADTDASPYDSGSYASSTTYVTGKATELCARKLRDKICLVGAKMLGCDEKEVEFDGDKVIYRGEKTLEKQKFPCLILQQRLWRATVLLWKRL